ncbi:DUF3021 domain-containing protein [Anaerovorax odorimutans]|uniref:DUF3021 domain-containing protein n=1 Tax=Anaerovorax odorimutans TaxID=109327 RepID=A0ABT1RSL9_9FIRM|nr:DUF3021 family protein [Anaerovorax odorimutans]MCQ4638204.1 DUF3021 domain-containing protein [Anaerovorax odorimutans]
MDKLNLKECVLIDCVSFTAVSVILSLLSFNEDLMSGFDHTMALEVFACTTLISILMYPISRISFRSAVMAEAAKLLDVAVCVLGFGGSFGWFPWEGKYIFEACLIFVAVFIITSAVLFWQASSIANKINRKIREKEHETHH